MQALHEVGAGACPGLDTPITLLLHHRLHNVASLPPLVRRLLGYTLASAAKGLRMVIGR